jgi:hypothetical protein
VVDASDEHRAKAKERQRRRRQKMAGAGAPSTHAINRALAEALLFCVERNHSLKVPRSQTTVEFGAVIAHASLILIVGNGHSPTFEVTEVHRAMQERFRRRPRTWTIKP